MEENAGDADAPSDASITVNEELIIVTGSAIRRTDLQITGALEIVYRQDIEATGQSSLGSILQQLPAQSNAANTQFNRGGDGSTNINLRGLGAQRTLILVNGRRHVSSGANIVVDLNAIPLPVIDRIEVLKDAASAIYGADAVGGVVNIVTRGDFAGTEATAYMGSTGDGLGRTYGVSMMTGHRSRRGHIVFSADYYEQQPISAGAREYSSTDKQYDWLASKGDPDGNPDGNDVWYPGNSSATPEGMLVDRLGLPGNDAWQSTVCPGNICQVGSYREFQFPGETGLGDLYNYIAEQHLVTPQQRYNIFTSANHGLTDSIRVFGEASYTNRRTEQRLASTPLFTISEGLTVSGDNYYNPFDRPFIDIRRRMTEAGLRRFSEDMDLFRIVGGLEGNVRSKRLSLLRGWRWNLSYNFGRSQGTYTNRGELVLSRLAHAVGPSYADANGNVYCGTQDDPGPDDCVPLNLFGGAGTITPEMVAYVGYTGLAQGFTEERSMTAKATGRLFQTPWGGNAAVALGAEYRRTASAYEPDPVGLLGDTTGAQRGRFEGSLGGREVFGELLVTPVVGKTLAEKLELSVGVRGFIYPYGSDETWKAGGLWHIGWGLSMRGAFAKGFRAPTIEELFEQRVSQGELNDPCDTSLGPPPRMVEARCRGEGIPDDFVPGTRSVAFSTGNPDLEIEIGDTFSSGLDYEPTFLPGLRVTLNYFRVEISNLIQHIEPKDILYACYFQGKYCDKIHREPVTHILEEIAHTIVNNGSIETAGVDFNIHYSRRMRLGWLRSTLQGTRLENYNQVFPNGDRIEGKGVYDLGVFPEWKFNLATNWTLHDWELGFNVRFIDGFRECEDNDCFMSEEVTEESPAPLSREVASSTTSDLFVNWSKKTDVGTMRLSVGVNNVFDQPPALIFNGVHASSDAATYSFLGRYFYTRLVLKI